MNPQNTRKIGYLVAILVLMLGMYFLGFPETRSADDPKVRYPGGWLAQVRSEHGLSEEHLGEASAGAETMRLATLGLRGVAAQILWEKANNYKMKKDWTNFSATLEQLAKVEPHFVNVWRFQAWNLSYNVSVEFDDYRERYRWVIRGIEFLKEGIQYNQHEPALVSDTGWFIANKIGTADESVLFRKLFRQDPDFHKDGAVDEERDNWLVGKRWHIMAEGMVDRGDDIKKVTPVLFYSRAPMCQMNYADALEKDGQFGDKARSAFAKASEDWVNFGDRPMKEGELDPETGLPKTIHLNDPIRLRAEAADLLKQLDALAPTKRKEILAARRQQLSQSERDALDTPPEKRNEKQVEAAAGAERRLEIDPEQLARELPSAQQTEGLRLARGAKALEEEARTIDRSKQVVNFDYWDRHAKVEQATDALEARRAIYEGEQAAKKADLKVARKRYEDGIALWRKVLDANPGLDREGGYTRDLVDVIKAYRKVLERSDVPFDDKNFPLADFWKKFSAQYPD